MGLRPVAMTSEKVELSTGDKGLLRVWSVMVMARLLMSPEASQMMVYSPQVVRVGRGRKKR